MIDLLPMPRTALTRKVLALQIEHAYQQLGTSLAVNLVNGLVLVLIFYGDIDGRKLLLWIAAIYAVTLARYALLRRFRDPRLRQQTHETEWGSLFLIGALGSGILWGAAGIALFHPTSQLHQIFLAFALGGMIAGALPLLSALTPAFQLFAIPVSLPIILRLIAEGDRVSLTMAVLFLIFMVAMLVSSSQFSHILRESIELRLKLLSSIEEKQQQAMLARIDSLTGIANRRLFEEALANEWKRAARTRTPLSMAIADIDYFKRYNDHLGHPGGDQCLRKVAESMATAARRPGDLAARIGGEEFAFILPNTQLSDAAAIAERIREDIESLRIPHPTSPTSDCITVSLGVAEILPDETTSTRDLIKAADAALYEAKDRGRNRVMVAGD